MISLLCPKCGFVYSIAFSENISQEERDEIYSCPCGAKMQEVEFSVDYIPTFEI